jgi:hypothetical protein
MIVRLLYVSRSNGPQTTTVTRSILEQAQTHNAAQGITGVLCQGQGFFLQVLRGREAQSTRFTDTSRSTCATKTWNC